MQNNNKRLIQSFTRLYYCTAIGICQKSEAANESFCVDGGEHSMRSVNVSLSNRNDV